MGCRFRFHIRLIFAFVFTSLLPGFVGDVSAGAPMAKFQAPGFYRLMLGEFEITALNDGFAELEVKLMRNAPETEIQNLLAQRVAGISKVLTSVNAYLLNTGSKLILIDAGGGVTMGPKFGDLTKNLGAAGYSPDQIDFVLLTHMHRDHIGGLLDAAGKPVFSNAVIMVSEAESQYWLSAAEAEKASADRQKSFKLASDVAAAYSAQGKWKTFHSGELFPGIKASVMPGHTPGHSVFEISSNGQTFLVLGDTVHFMAVQFAKPDVFVDFDNDSAKAVATRRSLFKRLSESKEMAAGMHLPFPGIGRVLTSESGGYIWVPVEFSPTQR